MSPYDDTYDQPTLAPTRKIKAAMIGGFPVSVLITWGLTALLGVPIPAEVGAAIGGLLATTAGYFTKEKMQ